MSRPTAAMSSLLAARNFFLEARTARTISTSQLATTTAPSKVRVSPSDAMAYTAVTSFNDNKSSSPSGDPASEEKITYTTFTAFDPGATRSLLASMIPLPLSMGNSADTAVTTALNTATSSQLPHNNNDTFTTQPNHPAPPPPATPFPTSPATPHIITVTRPWPYTLPRSMRPQSGTTFASLHGPEEETEIAVSGKECEHVSVLQAILYGLPDPDKLSFRKQVARGLFGRSGGEVENGSVGK